MDKNTLLTIVLTIILALFTGSTVIRVGDVGHFEPAPDKYWETLEQVYNELNSSEWASIELCNSEGIQGNITVDSSILYYYSMGEDIFITEVDCPTVQPVSSFPFNPCQGLGNIAESIAKHYSDANTEKGG